MGLYNRLVGSTDPDLRIGIHGFVGGLKEWQDGAKTRADIISAWSLSTADESDLDWLKGKYNSAPDKLEFFTVLERILILGSEGKLGYNTKSNFVSRINDVSST